MLKTEIVTKRAREDGTGVVGRASVLSADAPKWHKLTRSCGDSSLARGEYEYTLIVEGKPVVFWVGLDR
jgi:hypothetical protein